MGTSISTIFSALAAATVNNTLVKTGKVRLVGGSISNNSATKYFIKFYDKATAPVAGTDIPVWRIQLAAGANVSVASSVGEAGVYFSLGMGFSISAGSADTDTTAVTAANDVFTNLTYFNG